MSNDYLRTGVSEMNCGYNFSYLLDSPNSFVPMQYKVMSNQTSGFLLPCTKMQYNGKVQLYYQTKNKVPFSDILPSLRGESLLQQVYEIVRAVVQVESVGFLRGENINLSNEKLFVDLSTNRVSLTYLPCVGGFFENNAAMENALRTGMILLLNNSPEHSERKMKLAAALSSPAAALQDILKNSTLSFGEKQSEPSLKKQLFLHMLYRGKEIDIPITKESFIIGRDPMADYVVTFNDYIGRKHCRISSRDDKFFIFDLNSTNHTFLNQKRLTPGIEYPLKNGDHIALANSTFDVVIG